MIDHSPTFSTKPSSDGPASRSYGLQVAQLAGVPRAIIDSARRRLQEIEQASPAAAAAPLPQTDLFDRRQGLIDALREAEPDHLSPRQALDLLYRLRTLLD